MVQGISPIPARPDFWDGVQNAGVDAAAQLPGMMPTPVTICIDQIRATLDAIDAYQKGYIVDAINVVNPLIAVANISLAIDKGDNYSVTRQSVAIGATVVGSLVAGMAVSKAASGGKGGKTTRGPPASTAAPNAPKQRGGENPAAARGRQMHEEFKEKARAKGWDTRHGQMKDPTTGKELRPDAITRNGNPIELKPNTPSGRAAGKRQMKKYEAASNGKKGRVIYYDP